MRCCSLPACQPVCCCCPARVTYALVFQGSSRQHKPQDINQQPRSQLSAACPQQLTQQILIPMYIPMIHRQTECIVSTLKRPVTLNSPTAYHGCSCMSGDRKHCCIHGVAGSSSACAQPPSPCFAIDCPLPHTPVPAASAVPCAW